MVGLLVPSLCSAQLLSFPWAGPAHHVGRGQASYFRSGARSEGPQPEAQRAEREWGGVLGLSLPHTHTHTHPFNGPLSWTTWVSRYQKGKTNLDFTEARDSEWQWHQLGYVQVCTSLETDNYASTRPLSFLQAGCPSWCPTNNVKARRHLH